MTWGLVRQDRTAALELGFDVAPWLTDDFLESYVSWREESDSVRTAYEHWRGRKPKERGMAFAVYRAALDREERAALTFRELAERVRGRRA